MRADSSAAAGDTVVLPGRAAGALHTIAELPPRTRAAVGLRFIAGASAEETAAILRLGTDTLRDALRSVYQALGASAPPATGRSEAATGSGSPEPSTTLVWRGSLVAAEERSADPVIAAKIRAEIAGLPVRVDADAVTAALAAAPRRRVPPWWPLGAIGGLLVLAVVVLAAVGGLTSASQPGASGRADPSSRATPGQGTGPAPVTLADCGIGHADAPLAFSGWVTLDALNAIGGQGELSDPVYAVVTHGSAETAASPGQSTDAGSSPPVGGIGCAYDPATSRHFLVDVPPDWTPPAIADGCPAAGTDTYAGEPEIGGPRAFVVAFPSLAWLAPATSPESLLVRLDPVPSAGSVLGAWLQPLGPGERQPGQVTSGPRVAPAASASRELRYYTALLPPFDAAGCWVIGFTVDGRDAGSVIVPVMAAGRP